MSCICTQEVWIELGWRQQVPNYLLASPGMRTLWVAPSLWQYTHGEQGLAHSTDLSCVARHDAQATPLSKYSFARLSGGFPSSFLFVSMPSVLSIFTLSALRRLHSSSDSKKDSLNRKSSALYPSQSNLGTQGTLTVGRPPLKLFTRRLLSVETFGPQSLTERWP